MADGHEKTVEAEPAPLVTKGRWTSLRPVNPGDYGWLFDLFTDSSNLHSWNLRGRVPSYEEFPGLLWDRVLVQFAVIANSTNAPIGLATIYSADFRSGFAKFALILNPEYRQLGWSLEGAALTLTYGFQNWDLRKFFIEMLEFNSQGSGLTVDGSPFVEEGRYRDFEFYDGDYWDLIIYGLERAAWQTRTLMRTVS